MPLPRVARCPQRLAPIGPSASKPANPVWQLRKIPVTQNLDIIPFLVDIGTIGDWNIQGLPTDPLSIQNGILVTRSSRWVRAMNLAAAATPRGRSRSRSGWARQQATGAMGEGDRPVVHPVRDPLRDVCLLAV